MAVIGVISLGCDKNRVDTENIMTECARYGHIFTGAFEDAEVLIVNTCAFLETAREEAIDAVLEAASYKQSGKCRLLVVAGCLVMLCREEAERGLPEVDLWLTPEKYRDAGRLIAEMTGEIPDNAAFVESRLLSTPAHYAYLKIADGCNNRCTFCLIPSIRGRYVSADPEEIVREAKSLVVRGGAKELILVAQDTTSYGSDLDGVNLSGLLGALVRIEGLEQVRLLYCYPERITDELIDVIATEPKIVKYLDIPMQHASDRILKRMNRRSTRASVTALIQKLRARIPGIVLRTTIMIGFPGETEEDADELCNFIREARLDHIGFFAYSREEGTPSARLPDQVPENVKAERLERVIYAQQQIAFSRADRLIGSVVRVRYEDIDYDRGLFIGRPVSSAPEIDPVVFFPPILSKSGRSTT